MSQEQSVQDPGSGLKKERGFTTSQGGQIILEVGRIIPDYQSHPTQSISGSEDGQFNYTSNLEFKKFEKILSIKY